MIRHPLGLRLDPENSVRDQIHAAARLGARGVVVEAIGDVAPHRLGETGRRELRHILRSVEMTMVGLALPTRRPFDTTDQLDERMRRADAAFAMAYELGTTVVLARAGAISALKTRCSTSERNARTSRYAASSTAAWPVQPASTRLSSARRG